VGLREFYAETPSTQNRATELARAGAGEGTRVVARTYRAGRSDMERLR
jgi:biotin-(acetyl-CoA carboxylase) ligase